MNDRLMEEPIRPPRRPPAFFIMLVSFILGSFSGAAFGVLFALSLNEQQFPWRQAAATADKPAFKLLSAEDAQVIAAAKRVSPAVVSIAVTKEVAYYDRTGLFPFEDFFGFEIRPPSAPGEIVRQQVGGGTGFIVASDGLIVTNRHVVADEEADYDVILSDGASHRATVLARDPVLDLAFLRIQASGLPTVQLGDSDGLQIGETVIAIGNALSEYQNTVTKGVISGINRRVIAGGAGGSEVIEEALQTDAAINPGNSGGPLVNLRGEVVGVNTAVNRAGQSIGFAIPISAARSVIEGVRTQGRIVRPWLGVRYVLLTPEAAKDDKLALSAGARIERGRSAAESGVVKGSPAEAAGLREGDVILEVDGQKVGMDRPLSSLIARKKPGDRISLLYWREGAERTVDVILGELPSSP